MSAIDYIMGESQLSQEVQHILSVIISIIIVFTLNTRHPYITTSILSSILAYHLYGDSTDKYYKIPLASFIIFLLNNLTDTSDKISSEKVKRKLWNIPFVGLLKYVINI